jgi:hypothetical protein
MRKIVFGALAFEAWKQSVLLYFVRVNLISYQTVITPSFSSFDVPAPDMGDQ